MRKVSTYNGIDMLIGWNDEEAYLIIDDKYEGVIFGNTFRTASIFEPAAFLIDYEYNNYNNDARKYNMFIIGVEWVYGGVTRKTYYNEIYDIVISTTYHINPEYLGIITVNVLINKNTGGIRINQAKFATIYKDGTTSCRDVDSLSGVSVAAVLS